MLVPWCAMSGSETIRSPVVISQTTGVFVIFASILSMWQEFNIILAECERGLKPATTSLAQRFSEAVVANSGTSVAQGYHDWYGTTALCRTCVNRGFQVVAGATAGFTGRLACLVHRPRRPIWNGS